jgi:hypothetical protein
MIVADNTLISYFTIEGEFTEQATQVRQKDPEWAAPLPWRAEFLNVPLVTHDGEVLEAFPETAVHPDHFLEKDQ